VSTALSLREYKKAMTRAALQEQALRLFLAKGYDATTVEEIAAAAGVSHMTFFRYYPTKEDVVLSDDYDALIVQGIRERPVGEPAVLKIRQSIRQGLDQVYLANRDSLLARTRLIIGTPALRARLWGQQRATEALLAAELVASGNFGNQEDDIYHLRVRVIASACLAAIVTAVEVWAETNGTSELPDLIDRALTSLAALQVEPERTNDANPA